MSPITQTSGSVLAAVVLAALSACASAPTYFGPPAREGAVLTGFTEPLRDRPGFELYIRNDSEGRVDVTSVILYECENVKGGCFFWDPDLVLDPGQIARVKTVEPGLRNRRFTYRWRYTYNRLRDGGDRRDG